MQDRQKAGSGEVEGMIHIKIENSKTEDVTQMEFDGVFVLGILEDTDEMNIYCHNFNFMPISSLLAKAAASVPSELEEKFARKLALTFVRFVESQVPSENPTP